MASASQIVIVIVIVIGHRRHQFRQAARIADLDRENRTIEIRTKCHPVGTQQPKQVIDMALSGCGWAIV